MSKSVPEDGPDDIPLYYTLTNTTGKSTIVLIHGASCSGRNWDLVVSHLNSYHLLIPDQPGHGQSRKITTFSVEYSSRLLDKLIRRHAVKGRAHIVGHSLGAHVAISLATLFPDAVDTVFVSGFEIYPPTTFTPVAPYAIWFDHRIQKVISRFLDQLADGWYGYPTWGITCMHNGSVPSDCTSYDRNNLAFSMACTDFDCCGWQGWYNSFRGSSS
jgi:pimeloyl-ACP methyl ester carboxylesterase